MIRLEDALKDESYFNKHPYYWFAGLNVERIFREFYEKRRNKPHRLYNKDGVEDEVSEDLELAFSLVPKAPVSKPKKYLFVYTNEIPNTCDIVAKTNVFKLLKDDKTKCIYTTDTKFLSFSILDLFNKENKNYKDMDLQIVQLHIEHTHSSKNGSYYYPEFKIRGSYLVVNELLDDQYYTKKDMRKELNVEKMINAQFFKRKPISLNFIEDVIINAGNDGYLAFFTPSFLDKYEIEFETSFCDILKPTQLVKMY